MRFFGGSKDGQDLALPEGFDSWKVPIMAPVTMDDYPYRHDIVNVEIYVKQRIRGATEMFEVMCPQDWTGDDLIRHLVSR